MKKNIKIVTVLLAGLIISASGCGPVDENTTLPSESVSESKVSEVSVSSTAVNEKQKSEETVNETKNKEKKNSDSAVTSAAVKSESEKENIPDSKKTASVNETESDISYSGISIYNDRDTAASEALKVITQLDNLAVGNIDKDDSDTVEINGETYLHVTDKRFSSRKDIEKYALTYISDRMAQGRYENLMDNDTRRYQDINGKLYVAPRYIAYGYSWTGKVNALPKDCGISIEAEYDDFGAVSTVMIYLDNNEGKEDFYRITEIREESDDYNSQLENIAGERIQQYIHIEDILAVSDSVLQKDRSDVYKDEYNYEYIHAESSDFSSVSELKSYISQYFTGSALINFEQEFFGGSPAVYIENDNKLYCLDGGRGSSIYELKEDTLRLYDVSDAGFKADIECRYQEDSFLMTFDFSGKEDNYRISDIRR